VFLVFVAGDVTAVLRFVRHWETGYVKP
jgi:hypothetical protein